MSTAPQPHLLDRVEEVEALFDQARADPVVVVTSRNGEPEPLIYARDLARQLQPLAVRILPAGPLT